jgi:hypothetical protein
MSSDDVTHLGKTVAKPRRRGRPTRYTAPLGKAICKMLCMGTVTDRHGNTLTMTLNTVCQRPRMPRESTVRGWAIDLDHPFSAMYARAREVGYYKMADETIEIADDSSRDWKKTVDKQGNDVIVADHDHIARSRLRVDTRKWLLSKVLPKIYGDRVTQEHVGKDGGPVQLRQVDPAAMQAIRQRFQQALPRVQTLELTATTVSGPARTVHGTVKRPNSDGSDSVN